MRTGKLPAFCLRTHLVSIFEPRANSGESAVNGTHSVDVKRESRSEDPLVTPL